MRESAPVESNRPSHRFKFFSIALLLIFLFGAGVYALRYELRSAALLIQFLNPHASGLLVRMERHQLAERGLVMPTAQGSVRDRIYVPRGVAHPRGMVLVPGIHH